ncbi:MAG: winged helix-turn-helix domain-containing protein [Bacteriovoracales bacterium]|nr:winged helix-turn-helix domain-containing protein [Bacteriovoracales bacterium]
MQTIENTIFAVLANKEGQNVDPSKFSEEERRAHGETHYRLGKIYYDKSDLDSAKGHFERALGFCMETKDFYFEFKVLGFLLRTASEMLDSEASESYMRRSDSITQRAAGELGTLDAEVFYNLGLVKTYYGKFEEAVDNFQLAISKSKKEKSLEVLAKSYHALATVNYQNKKFQQALNCLTQLSKLLEVLEKNYLKGAMSLLSGNIYLEFGDYDMALKLYQKANIYLTTKSCWNLYGYILLGKGTILRKMGKFQHSLWHFQMAKEAVNGSQFKRLQSLIQTEMDSLNDSSVDIYLDQKNRMVHEKVLGTIDFKHRFILLEILFLVAKNPGVYYDKEKLTDLVWKDRYNPMIHDKLIYTSISRLRKMIEPKGENRKYIIRSKEGYAFNPHVNVRFNQEHYTHVKSLGHIDISSPV